MNDNWEIFLEKVYGNLSKMDKPVSSEIAGQDTYTQTMNTSIVSPLHTRQWYCPERLVLRNMKNRGIIYNDNQTIGYCERFRKNS